MGRLLKVIHLVVDQCQTCGVPGRFIGNSVAFLRDVVGYATSTNIPVLLFSRWTRKRLSTGWTGPFFVPLWLGWVLGSPLSVGSTCFTPAPRVLLSLVVT